MDRARHRDVALRADLQKLDRICAQMKATQAQRNKAVVELDHLPANERAAYLDSLAERIAGWHQVSWAAKQESVAKHTPWEVKGIGHNVYIETVSGKPDGGFVCDMQADESDTPEERARIEALAQRIVRAVNCHDDLLAACRILAEHASEQYPHFESERGQEDIKIAHAAIAKAEGADHGE